MVAVIQMVPLVLDFIPHMSHQDLCVLIAPAKNASKKSQGIRFNAGEHLLALVQPELFKLAIFRPRPDRYLNDSVSALGPGYGTAL